MACCFFFPFCHHPEKTRALFIILSERGKRTAVLPTHRAGQFPSLRLCMAWAITWIMQLRTTWSLSEILDIPGTRKAVFEFELAKEHHQAFCHFDWDSYGTELNATRSLSPLWSLANLLHGKKKLSVALVQAPSISSSCPCPPIEAPASFGSGRESLRLITG